MLFLHFEVLNNLDLLISFVKLRLNFSLKEKNILAQGNTLSKKNATNMYSLKGNNK